MQIAEAAIPLCGVWRRAKGPRGCPPEVKTVPDRELTFARALQPLAQLRQNSPKAGIVRGAHNSVCRPRLSAPSRGCPRDALSRREGPAKFAGVTEVGNRRALGRAQPHSKKELNVYFWTPIVLHAGVPRYLTARLAFSAAQLKNG